MLADLTEMGLVHARDVGRARVYRLNRDHEDLARLVRADDALVESWLRDARTVSGPDLTTRMTLLDV